MYGAGIPILFPIGFCAFAVIYLIERYTVASHYRKPPRYSEQLTVSAINDILWTPVLYSIFGFWMLSNRQYFSNKYIPIERYSDVQRYGHYILTSLFSINPGTPFLILFII